MMSFQENIRIDGSTPRGKNPERVCFLLLFPLLLAIEAHAQVRQFPFVERFDSVIAPALPFGWISSTNRLSSGDFTTTTSTPRSVPNAVLSTNAAIEQTLTTPLIDLEGKEVDSLIFFERRSSSHNSAVVVEGSIDGGSSFSIPLSDPILNPGTTSYVRRAIAVPSALSDQPQVRIRWRVVGDGTGTTGTYRIDDITLSVQYQRDLAVTTIRSFPEHPVRGDSFSIAAIVKNVGRSTIEEFTAEFFHDSNQDGIGQPDELIDVVHVGYHMSSGESLTVVSPRRLSMSSGFHYFSVTAHLASDANTGNNNFSTGIEVGHPPRSIVLNELMYAPHTGEPEWVELYNASPDPIDLNNWKISNRNTSTRHSISQYSTLLPSAGYCVLTRDTSLFSTVYVTSSGMLIPVASLPTAAFSNAGDAVVLFDARGNQMDSVRYSPSWGGTSGKSLERIAPEASSTDSTNWGTSRDSSGSTPGRHNSRTPMEFDLSAVRLLVHSRSTTLVSLAALVRNVGRQAVERFSVSLFRNSTVAPTENPEELIATQESLERLHVGDSVWIQFIWANPGQGKRSVTAIVDFPADQRISDNRIIDSVKIPFAQRSLVINEIMYEPRTGEAEYVELYNPGAQVLDVSGWRLSDIRDTSTRSTATLLSSSPLLLEAGEYMVVASDSAIFRTFPHLTEPKYRVVIKRSAFSLNNNGDSIILTDLTGEAIDSVYYHPSWHNPEIDKTNGRSLERINPNLPVTDSRNWSTSASPDGGTPGRQNSLFTMSVPSTGALSINPNPFSPDGDGFEDVTILQYRLPATTAIIRVRIFDSSGRLVRTLANGEPSGSTGELIWDGYRDDRQRSSIGIHIILLEAFDSIGGELQTLKGVVVVAAKL